MKPVRFLLVICGCAFLLALPLLGEDIDANKATHKEVESLGMTPETEMKRLGSLTLSNEGNLLAGDLARKLIKVISPDGKLIATWRLQLTPYVIHQSADGAIYVGGKGEVAKLDKSGTLLKQVKAEAGGFPNSKVSGLTTSGNDLFVAFGSRGTLRSRSTLFRLTHDIEDGKVIVEGLRGCCQRLDITAKDGVLYIAENARHRVVKYDREGKLLGKWGARSRKEIEGFGSCCNPMNVGFGPDGVFYTAEAGLGRIKRYSPDGKYLGLVGYIGVARFTRASRLSVACSNIAFAVNKDGSRIYVMDYKNSFIRVLVKK